MTSAIWEDYRVEPIVDLVIITTEQEAANMHYVLGESIKVMIDAQRYAETFDEDDRLRILRDRLADIQRAVEAQAAF